MSITALILEDDKNRIKEFRSRFLERGIVGTFVQTARDAIDQLKENKFDIVFLDHDLGGDVYVDTSNKNTGSEVARFLQNNPVKSVVVIHSLNTSAVGYMKSLIHGSYSIPFVWGEVNFNRSIRFS